MRIGFLTCADLPDLTSDDQLAAAALEARGHSVTAARWDHDPDWRDCDALIVRSIWDYHLRIDEFSNWLSCVEASGKVVLNPVATLRWNFDKRYLRELETGGVAIVPTEFVDRGSAATLAEILDRCQWREAVVKPAVSATAHGTWLAHEDPSPEERFRAMILNHDILVQQYQPQIRTEGEWSLIFFAGAYSHAVRKRAAPGDFRVQDDFGGTIHSDPVPPGFIEQASKILTCVPGAMPAYARVDGVESQGRLLLMELELIEPHLYFALNPKAPARFAAAVKRSL